MKYFFGGMSGEASRIISRNNILLKSEKTWHCMTTKKIVKIIGSITRTLWTRFALSVLISASIADEARLAITHALSSKDIPKFMRCAMPTLCLIR